MNFFEQILHALSGEMTRPTNYGWFHLMFLAIIIGLTVFLCIKFKNASDKTYRRIILIGWIVILVLEIYKQLIFSFEFDGTNATWDYQWYAFPFQLCSTPIFLLPFVSFLKEGKVRDSIVAFIATFAMFGGLVTYIYPNDVFITTIGINIQTMVHHGLQIVLGIYSIVYFRKKWNIKFFLSGIITFVAMLAVAMLLNLTIIYATNETFNMFYISPHFPCALPLLNIIYANVPYWLFLPIYIIGFTLAALIMHYVAFGIMYGIRKRSKKSN